MKKLLIMGINTRGLVNSCFKLPYQCYSISYYLTSDFKYPYKEKHVLNQYDGKSCGFFEKNYSSEKLLELSLHYLEEVDNVILSSGISANDFKGKFKKYKNKILGNLNIEDIKDKYKFYKKIRNKYLTPKTFKINHKNNEDNIYETFEIIKQNNNSQFIIKPLQGSGGYGVNYLKYDDKNDFKIVDFKKINNNYNDNQSFLNYEKSGFIIQEYVEGINISSSILSTKKEAKTIINSKMLTESDFGVKNSFKYCGNIVPFNLDIENNLNDLFNNSFSKNKNITTYKKLPDKNVSYNQKIVNNISEDLISQLKLIGSNGIDMILTNKKNKTKLSEEPYIIEVNPRFQGTYECVEEVLKINLLDAHIKACQGKLINIPLSLKKDEFSIKRVICSDAKTKVGNIDHNQNMFDIPLKGSIIEKNEPLVTIVSPKNNLKVGINTMKKNIDNLNKNVHKIIE